MSHRKAAFSNDPIRLYVPPNEQPYAFKATRGSIALAASKTALPFRPCRQRSTLREAAGRYQLLLRDRVWSPAFGCTEF